MVPPPFIPRHPARINRSIMEDEQDGSDETRQNGHQGTR